MQLAGPEMQARLAKAGVNIERFARKVACSSGELFEDVKETILAELGPKGPTKSPKHSRSAPTHKIHMMGHPDVVLTALGCSSMPCPFCTACKCLSQLNVTLHMEHHLPMKHGAMQLPAVTDSVFWAARCKVKLDMSISS